MLTQLTINNFAIVRQLEIELAKGMSVITGETGAGKSIAIDALGLCLGQRIETSMVREGQERAEKQELEEGFLQKLRLVEVDGAKGLAYANNEVELYTEILRGFVEEYEEKRQKMLDYVADLKRNGEDLVNLAHQMKGEARGIGGTHFGEHFYALELAGREKNTEKIRSLLPEVLEEWERTIRGISGCLG